MKFTRLSTLLCAAILMASQANAALMITEIVDGDLSGGLPKFVEIKNAGSTTVDLSNYSIGNFNNGGLELGGGASAVLSGSLSPGDVYVISYENSDVPGTSTFFDVYGFDADNLELGTFINGDDVVALFEGPASTDGAGNLTGTIVDIYGVIGVNGDDEVWDYTDSYAYRNPDVMSPNTTFSPSEWTFAGRSALDGLDAAGHAAATTPGTHNMIPEPSTILMALMAASGVGAVAMRRRLG